MISPSSFAVFALKFLQKSMMFSPCGPSAVPTGGAGVALPAAICSFTTAWIFFAIMEPYAGISRFHDSTMWRRAACRAPQAKSTNRQIEEALDLLHLHEIELDRGGPA